MTLPLRISWRKSLANSEIPSIFKKANIIPVFKGGCRTEAKNYRPIALSSNVVKVFEKILKKHILYHLETNNLLNDFQHGFRGKISCLTELTDFHNSILNSLGRNTAVDAVYLDFAKAYDKVDHGILGHKLKILGIKGKVGDWIQSFLTNRTQVTCVDGAVSNEVTVKSGIPQGSVLGGGASKCKKMILSFHQICKTISLHQNFQMCSFRQKTVFRQVISKSKKYVSLHCIKSWKLSMYRKCQRLSKHVIDKMSSTHKNIQKLSKHQI